MRENTRHYTSLPDEDRLVEIKRREIGEVASLLAEIEDDIPFVSDIREAMLADEYQETAG